MPPETIAQIGERELIRRLEPFMPVRGKLAGGRIVITGPGDDCAVVCDDPPGQTILTTDLLVEGTHFLCPATLAEWQRLGRKAVAANLSDVASMGGHSRWLLISLAIPGDLPVAAVEELYRGMSAEARHAGAEIIGGDTTRGPAIILNIAVVGWVPMGQRLATRDACRPGQAVYVTGTLGGSLAGLRLLTERTLAPLRSCYRGLITRHQSPRAQVAAGPVLARACDDLAMIDISDSLHNELHLLAEASGVGFQIDLDCLPLHPALGEFANDVNEDAAQLALFSGEEYELLLTTSGTPPPGVALTTIGHVTKGRGIIFTRQGKPVRPRDTTFRHFG